MARQRGTVGAGVLLGLLLLAVTVRADEAQGRPSERDRLKAIAG